MLRGTSEMLLTDKKFGFVFCTKCWIGFDFKEVFIKMKIKKPLCCEPSSSVTVPCNCSVFSFGCLILPLQGEGSPPTAGGFTAPAKASHLPTRTLLPEIFLSLALQGKWCMFEASGFTKCYLICTTLVKVGSSFSPANVTVPSLKNCLSCCKRCSSTRRQ